MRPFSILGIIFGFVALCIAASFILSILFYVAIGYGIYFLAKKAIEAHKKNKLEQERQERIRQEEERQLQIRQQQARREEAYAKLSKEDKAITLVSHMLDDPYVLRHPQLEYDLSNIYALLTELRERGVKVSTYIYDNLLTLLEDLKKTIESKFYKTQEGQKILMTLSDGIGYVSEALSHINSSVMQNDLHNTQATVEAFKAKLDMDGLTKNKYDM